jgi:hypothetical protein
MSVVVRLEGCLSASLNFVLVNLWQVTYTKRLHVCARHSCDNCDGLPCCSLGCAYRGVCLGHLPLIAHYGMLLAGSRG